MVEKPDCSEHGEKHMVHENRQKNDYWICTKCEKD